MQQASVQVMLYKTDADELPTATVNYEANTVEEKYIVGDWVEVRYDDKLFPGEIVKFQNEDFVVSVMREDRRGRWYWPMPADVIAYTPADVMKKIQPPDPIDVLHGIDYVLYQFNT